MIIYSWVDVQSKFFAGQSLDDHVILEIGRQYFTIDDEKTFQHFVRRLSTDIFAPLTLVFQVSESVIGRRKNSQWSFWETIRRQIR